LLLLPRKRRTGVFCRRIDSRAHKLPFGYPV
jgi:hypothetical protein